MAARGRKKFIPAGNISVRHALSDEEVKFCVTYLARGLREEAECYRKAFLYQRGDGEWVELTLKQREMTEKRREELAFQKAPVDDHEVQKQSRAALKVPHLKNYIDELQLSPGIKARQILSEQVMIGDDRLARDASKEILAREDKLGFRDAVDQWAEIMREVGAEVVVPIKDNEDVVIPFAEVFPKRTQE